MPDEIIRTGPAAYISQWPLERTIGDLGQQVKQPSNPYANLSQRIVLQAQTNVLRSLLPDLDYKITDRYAIPHGGVDLGDHYALLRAADNIARPIHPGESHALSQYLAERDVHVNGPITKVVRWARLRLPNREIVRTRWKEILRPQDKIRRARYVNVSDSLYNCCFFFFLLNSSFLLSCPTQTSLSQKYCISFKWRSAGRSTLSPWSSCFLPQTTLYTDGHIRHLFPAGSRKQRTRSLT